LSTIIRKHNILCTTIQETKLAPNKEQNIHILAPKILIINNPNTENDRSAGTTFALNKDHLKNRTWDHSILIPGRAARLKIKKNNETQIDIINVYSPNETKEKIKFWKHLHEIIKKKDNWENTLLVGDFNFVESAIDRLPAHTDEKTITDAFNKIKATLQVTDGWRHQNETERAYTFSKQNPTALAQIDRIYVNVQKTSDYQNWEITENYNISDHQLVITEIIPQTTPIRGPGLWRLNNADEQHIQTRKWIKKLLKNTKEKLKATKDRKENNPQTIWAKTKEEIRSICIEEAKQRKNQLNKEKRKLKH
ncbi:Endonuclease/exonuclease/phosphatase, partial [Pisolithus croceorrhizus]